MTTRDNRIFHRYCPWYRRVLGAALTLIILPPLTSLDLLAADAVRKSATEQERRLREYEHFRDTLPVYVRGQLLPRARALADRAEAAAAAGLPGIRPDVEQFNRDLTLVAIAFADRASLEDKARLARHAGNAAPPSETTKRREQARHDVKDCLARIGTWNRYLISHEENVRSSAVIVIRRMTACIEQALDAAALPNVDSAVRPDTSLRNARASVDSNLHRSAQRAMAPRASRLAAAWQPGLRC